MLNQACWNHVASFLEDLPILVYSAASKEVLKTFGWIRKLALDGLVDRGTHKLQ